MSYIEKNLLPQERLVYRAHLHWVIYVSGVLLILASLFVFVAGSGPIRDRSVLVGLGVLLLIVGLCQLLIAWIRDKSSEFGVTDKRVLIKTGLIRRHSLELLLRQIEGISVDQGIVGRILGYGRVTVNGTGATKEPFLHISDPLEFRKQVQGQSIESSSASTPAVAAGEEKTCPNCAEQVKRAARVCRFCNYRFE